MSNNKKKVCFLHISDLHYLRDYGSQTGPFRETLQNMTPPLQQLDGLLAQTDAVPSFVLITGDLTHEGEEGDYLALLAGLQRRFPGIPLFTVPGNHDHPAAWQAVFGQGQPRVAMMPQEGFNLILLDNSHPDAPDGRITQEDVDALAKMLDASAKPAILATHHHLIGDQFVMPPADYPDSFPDVLAKGKVLAIFNGHTHHQYRGSFAGVPVYTSGSLCFRGHNTEKGVDLVESPCIQLCMVIDEGVEVTSLSSQKPARILGRL